MTGPKRFRIKRRDGIWFGVWDGELGKWSGDKKWKQPAIAQSEANRLNRQK